MQVVTSNTPHLPEVLNSIYNLILQYEMVSIVDLTVTNMKIASSGMLNCVVWYILTDVSEVFAASIINGRVYQTTRHNIPEDSRLQPKGLFKI
jgi:hypothetical protein